MTRKKGRERLQLDKLEDRDSQQSKGVWRSET